MKYGIFSIEKCAFSYVRVKDSIKRIIIIVNKFIVLIKKVFMKKFMIALAFASLGTVAANAQSKVYSLNPFWNNWFVQVGVDMSLANPNQAKDWFDNVFPNGKSFGVDLAVGKWFSPQIGLRGKLQWENGIIENKHQNWKDFSIQENPEWVPPYDKERFGLENGLIGGYGMIAGDVMLNLSNIICGYNENRVWNFIPFAGAGFYRAFDEVRH